VEGKPLYHDPRPGQRVPKCRCGPRSRLSNGGIESTSRKADRKASTSPNPTTRLLAGSSRAGPFEVLVFEWVDRQLALLATLVLPTVLVRSPYLTRHGGSEERGV
jgi:hypothetical protein